MSQLILEEALKRLEKNHKPINISPPTLADALRRKHQEEIGEKRGKSIGKVLGEMEGRNDERKKIEQERKRQLEEQQKTVRDGWGKGVVQGAMMGSNFLMLNPFSDIPFTGKNQNELRDNVHNVMKKDKVGGEYQNPTLKAETWNKELLTTNNFAELARNYEGKWKYRREKPVDGSRKFMFRYVPKIKTPDDLVDSPLFETQDERDFVRNQIDRYKNVQEQVGKMMESEPNKLWKEAAKRQKEMPKSKRKQKVKA